MADLTDLQAAQSVKVVGSDLTGVESFPLAVDSSQQALVKDTGANTALASLLDVQTNGNQISKIKGGTDGSIIGNNGDRLKVDLTNSASTDIFGGQIIGNRYNQIQISFDGVPDPAIITNTTSGGATITQANGQTLYTSGTALTAQAKGVSVQKNFYKPGNEIYAYFTAAFTNPNSASTYQRIGPYDTNNGFFIGWNGLTFGVTRRTAAVDTFIARTSWNGDLLDGSSTSTFTRNGLPEAINLAFSNIFRIRFAWLGSGPIVFEVFSPDGNWVVFHTLKIPNSQLNPSISDPNLPMTVDVSKTSANAISLTIATACWAAGSTSNYAKINDTITDNSLANLTRSVITGRSTAGGVTYENVKVSPAGSVQVGGTLDAVTAITNPLPAGTNTIGASQIEGASDLTKIGNIGDALKVSMVPAGVTYTAAAVGIIAATNPTDIFVLRGSATKTVKIVDLQFSALKTTTGYNIVQGIKRSNDNASGTFTTPTIVPHDSTDVAATALVRAYTANPSALGSTVGTVLAFYSLLPSISAAAGGNIAGIDIIHNMGKPLTLRGTKELFAINMNGASIPGMEYTITVTWVEE